MRLLRACLATLTLAVVGLTLGLASCDGGTDFQCTEELPCTGFGEICIDGQCIKETCQSNLDCPMEHVCGAGGLCAAGCDNDNDCYPGSACNLELAECEDQRCTDTHIDCGYKEFCNVGTGDCYEAGGVYCRPCDPWNVANDCNGGDENGSNECWNNYCTVDCSGGKECPSGFQCYPFADSTGAIVSFQCLTYCWLYEDASMGSEQSAPPPAEGALPPSWDGALPPPGATSWQGALIQPPAARCDDVGGEG